MTKDSTVVRVQLRASVFSTSLVFFGGENTRSDGGLAIGLPEIFAEARNVFTEDLNIWIGNRLYRGPDVHIADYFYFNDRSGQGAGIEYKNTMLHVNFVTSTDTSQTVPPYFYVNTRTGTPSLELRERIILSAEQSFRLKNKAVMTFMGEFHNMPGPDEFIDSVSIPGDEGFVLGARIQFDLKRYMPGSFNQFTARLGTGIANGGDGGSSRTWLTYGAPNFNTFDFKSARGVEIVDHFLINYSDRFTLNGYFIYHFNKGAADTNGEAPTYFDRTVFNRKEDYTVGARGFYYFSDIFHLLTEFHYQQRKDGQQDWYRMAKISIAPTIVPFGERSAWSRPHLRFVTSIARYNDLAQQNLYSPYLELVGPEKWGFYFGLKAEWWTW
jgi:maltoporin